MNKIILVTLEDWICLQNFELDLRMLVADGGQVLEDQLGALRLPRPGLAADDHTLVLSVNRNQSFDNPNTFRDLVRFIILKQLSPIANT